MLGVVVVRFFRRFRLLLVLASAAWGCIGVALSLDYESGVRNGAPAYTVFEKEITGAVTGMTNLDKDSFGRLRVSSGADLLVFDGSSWVTYRQRASAGGEVSNIYTTIVGPDGRDYASSSRGIHRIRFLGNREFLLGPIVEGVDAEDERRWAGLTYSFVAGSDIYFLGFNRAVRFDTETGEVEDRVVDRQMSSRLISFGGNLIEYGSGDAIYVHKGLGDFEAIPTGLGHLGRNDIRHAAVWNGRLFLGHDRGISLLEEGAVAAWSSELDRLGSQNISSMAVVSEEYLAVAVRSMGIYLLNTDGQIVQQLGRQLDHRFGNAQNFLSSGNGSLWMSFGDSVVRVDFLEPISNFSSLSPIAILYPKVFFEAGVPYIVSDGRLARAEFFAGGGLKGYELLAADFEGDIECAIATEEGIVFSDYGGLHLLGGDSGEVVSLAPLTEVDVLFRLRGVPDVLLAAGRSGIHVLERIEGSWEFRGKTYPSPGRAFYPVELESGVSWVEQGLGLASRVWMEDGQLQVRTLGVEDGLPEHWVNVWEFRGRALVGAGSGDEILFWDEERGRFSVFDEAPMELLGGIAGITRPASDSFGNLWVPTNSSSHSVFRRMENGGYEKGNDRLAAIDNELILQAVPGEDGSMWMVGETKLFRFDPRFEREALAVAPTRIYQVEDLSSGRVLFDAREREESGEIEVPYADNGLRFHFTNPNIGYGRKVSHDYFVEGFSTNWSQLQSSSVLEINHLMEGRYRLLLRPNDGGKAVGEVSAVSFAVLPPFYRTPLAYMFYAVGFGALVWGVIRLARLRIEHRNRELEHLVENRTEGLNQANEELAVMYEKAMSADKAKGAFLATISHEMRTPLNAIIGPSELLMLSDHLPDQEQMFKMINNAGKDLLVFVEDVLQFSSGSATGASVVKAPLDIRAILEEIVDAVSLRFGSGGVPLRKRLAEDLPSDFLGDGHLLKQVVGNLLANAFKFTEAGEVVLAASVERSESGGERLLVSIEDTGIGIAQEDLKMIFEPFRQVDSSSSRKFEGAGLGLAICDQLVSKMGGELGCESELGKGSRFWFSLPLERAGEAGVAEEPAGVAGDLPSLSGKRVLVVDDNAANRVVACTILDGTGCVLEIAEDGAEAVRKALSESFDLILMDLRMPNMSGVDATRLIREQSGPNRNTCIVALSAFLSETAKQACEDVGIDRYLEKPVDPSNLREVVRELIGSEN